MNQTKIIGITGHRDIVKTVELKKHIKEFFINLQNSTSETKLLSPLADGADRLVAKIYLEIFKEEATLIVPMPFDQERYMKDFDSKSKKDFLNYLEVAEEIYIVEDREKDNYKSLGYHVVNKSDTLLALWDGTFNHKSGGTGNVVAYAKEKDKEVIHFSCNREN